ncbi:MAG: HEAT repeat domain-containing protein [Planctomycetes bacterium]|nr:HEAT repeat domain-containing protein [Planctomycetota bacterium]
MRSVSSVVVWLLAFWLIAHEGCVGAAAKPPSPTEAGLDELEKHLADIKERLGELLKPQGPKADEILGPLRKAFALDRMKGESQKVRDALAKVVITEDDADGLRLYCRSDYASAAKKFTDSDGSKPNREFPVYFLGAIAFQGEEYAKAEELFSQAIARNRECRSAFVLRRLAKLCDGRRGIPDLELALLFDQAARQAAADLALEKEIEEPTFAEMAFPTLASDPVLYKMLEALDIIRAEDLGNLLKSLPEAKSVERKLTIALLTGSEVLAKPLVSAIAQEHPESKDAKVYAFLHRHYVRPYAELRKPLDGFAAELTAVRQLDPDNGALMLLGIAPGPDGEDPEALKQEELALFRKGVKAREFRTFEGFLEAEVNREHTALYGGLWPCAPRARTPAITISIRWVAQRAAANIVQLAKGGKTDEAIGLLSDVEALTDRVRAEAYGWFRKTIGADMIVGPVYRTVRKSAQEAHDKRLLDRCLAGAAAVYRHEAEGHIVAGGFGFTPLRIPVLRLQQFLWRVEDTPGFATELYARRLRADPVRHYKSATKALAYAYEDYVMSSVYPNVVILGDLKNPEAVPLLAKLAKHSDPLLAYMAARALATR